MFQEIIDKGMRRRDEDAKRYADLDHDLCMLCGAYGADKRSLFIDCFYAVNEVVPEVIDIGGVGHTAHSRGFYLLICKSCRARLLGGLQGWANECRSLRDKPKDHDGHLLDENELDERKIPVRIHGIVRMLTADEYAAFRESL
jgi:hypothetical protein